MKQLKLFTNKEHWMLKLWSHNTKFVELEATTGYVHCQVTSAVFLMSSAYCKLVAQYSFVWQAYFSCTKYSNVGQKQFILPLIMISFVSFKFLCQVTSISNIFSLSQNRVQIFMKSGSLRSCFIYTTPALHDVSVYDISHIQSICNTNPF